VVLGSTQPPKEMSTRSLYLCTVHFAVTWSAHQTMCALDGVPIEYQEYFLGVKSGRCVRLTTLPPFWAIVTLSGNLNFLEPSGNPRPVMGLILIYILLFNITFPGQSLSKYRDTIYMRDAWLLFIEHNGEVSPENHVTAFLRKYYLQEVKKLKV